MKYEFEMVTPIYSGGGIYIFLGKLNNYSFLACDDEYTVRILDEIPFDDEQAMDEDIWYDEWQQLHLVADLDQADADSFFIDMLKWILENEEKIHDGNYLKEDMEAMLKELQGGMNGNRG